MNTWEAIEYLSLALGLPPDWFANIHDRPLWHKRLSVRAMAREKRDPVATMAACLYEDFSMRILEAKACSEANETPAGKDEPRT